MSVSIQGKDGKNIEDFSCYFSLLLLFFKSHFNWPSMILRLNHHDEKFPWQTPVGWFYRTPTAVLRHRADWLMQRLELWHLVLCSVAKVWLFPLENLSVCLKQMYVISALGLRWFNQNSFIDSLIYNQNLFGMWWMNLWSTFAYAYCH